MAEIRQIQVDGVNYDLVISEDEVSATAAAQSAAQALAYKNQAQTSAAQAQTQATNASNQADRAEDAADRAEAIVGGRFVSYGEDQGLTDAYKEQARKNIGAGGSNDNLLDNWYFVGGGSQLWDGVFPINQRGTTFYSLSYGNIFDRWHIQGSATTTCTLNTNGIAFAADTENCGLSQTISAGRIVDGKTYTLSVMDTAGNIYSGSRVLNTNGSWQIFDLGLSAFGWYNPCYVQENGQANVYILDRTGSGGSASIGIAAAKLEVGTVSTLANDAPPDFGAELRKCQRRLFRVSPMGTSSRGYAGFGSANSSKNILVFVPTPATLAAQPTVSFSNCNAYNYVASGSIAISSISIDSWTQNGVFLSCTPSDASQVVQYQPYVLRVAQGGYLQIACEL